MTINIWPGVAGALLATLIATGIAAAFPFFRNPINGAGVGRHVALDGARGYLALGVLFSHAVSFYFYKHGLGWHYPPSRLYTASAQISVSLFFMITGFLFWTKALHGPLRPFDHYRRRALRIVPLYMLLFLSVLTLVAVESRGRPRVPVGQLARDVAMLLVPGLRPMPHINGVDVRIVCAMTWTLRYEMVFYLLLPLAARFASPKAVVPLALCAMSACPLFWIDPTPFVRIGAQYSLLFVFGMIAAHVVPAVRAAGWTQRPTLSVVAIASIGLVGLLFDDCYSPTAYCLLLIAFCCFALGADLFGLLSSAGAQLLGTISYSVYLLHMMICVVLASTLGAVRPIEALSEGGYWAFVGGVVVVVILVCSATYRFIEYPFLSRRSCRRVSAPANSCELVVPFVGAVSQLCVGVRASAKSDYEAVE